MQILEHDDQRPLTGERLQQAAHRPLRLLDRSDPIRQADGTQDEVADQVAPLVGSQQADRLIPVVVREVADDLRERPVRDPLAVRETVTGQHPRLAWEAGSELGEQPCLADPRLAHHGDQPAAWPSDRLVERPPQQRQLRVSADEDGLWVPADRLGVGSNLREPERLDRLRLAVQIQRRHPLDLDRIAQQLAGERPDQDLARPRRLLQPSGDVDRIPRRERRARPEIAGHHLTRVHADPHADPNAALLLQLVVQAFQRPPHLERGPDRPQRVVLVHQRHPEHRHHRVADELLHQAAVPLEHRPHLRVVTAEHVPERLRVESLPERRRPGHVAEHGGHRLPQLVPRRRRHPTAPRTPCRTDPGPPRPAHSADTEETETQDRRTRRTGSFPKPPQASTPQVASASANPRTPTAAIYRPAPPPPGRLDPCTPPARRT